MGIFNYYSHFILTKSLNKYLIKISFEYIQYILKDIQIYGLSRRKTTKCKAISLTILMSLVSLALLIVIIDLLYSSSVVEIKSYYKNYDSAKNTSYYNLTQTYIQSQIFRFNLLSGSFDTETRCFLDTVAVNSSKITVKYNSPHLHVNCKDASYEISCLDQNIVDSKDFVFYGLFYFSIVLFIIVALIAIITLACIWFTCEKRTYDRKKYSKKNVKKNLIDDDKSEEQLFTY